MTTELFFPVSDKFIQIVYEAILNTNGQYEDKYLYKIRDILLSEDVLPENLFDEIESYKLVYGLHSASVYIVNNAFYEIRHLALLCKNESDRFSGVGKVYSTKTTRDYAIVQISVVITDNQSNQKICEALINLEFELPLI